MKRLLIILLSCVAILSNAQNLSTAQKQEALQCATNFCNLLERFCKGDRTLNTQINAICSGADCSAFDEIKTDKEITLRNYLYAIQMKYPQKLNTTITAPSLSASNIYIEPEPSVDFLWGKVDESDLTVIQMASVGIERVNNIFVVFDVTQSYPSLNKSIKKKIIYDTKAKKITAFIANNGSFINYLNGIVAISENRHDQALDYFERALQNDRTSLKNKLYGLSFACAGTIQNWTKALHYAELLGDPLYINLAKTMICNEKDQFEEAFKYALKIESLMEGRSDVSDYFRSEIYLLYAQWYLLLTPRSFGKASLYIEKARKLGNPRTGFIVYSLYNEPEIGDDFVDIETSFAYLQKSAQAGYPPAFVHWAFALENIFNLKSESIEWYQKAADSGSHLAMANLGRIYIENGDKQKGVELLKKSLAGNNLESDLEDFRLITGGGRPWPKTRDAVEQLLRTQSANSGSSVQSHTQSSESSTIYNNTTNTSSSHTTSSPSSYSSSSHSNNSYHYHGEFNEAKDEYVLGLSAGYVQKRWVYDYGDSKEKVNVFGEEKNTNGIQIGFRVDPQFKYGFGINTGLYYEYYFDKSPEINGNNGDYYRYEEHSLYLPIHFKYSLNFSEMFQLAFYGGIGLDYAISGNAYAKSDGETIDTFDVFDNDFDMKRFNASLEYGGAIRVSRFQLNFTMSKGFVNMSDNEAYKVKLNKQMNIALSIYF